MRYAVDKVAAQLPDLGRHLHRSVRTGTYCAYDPDPTSPLHWDL